LFILSADTSGMRWSPLPAAVLVAAFVAAPPAGAASTSVQLAPGVTLTHSTFGLRSHTTTLPERAVTLAVTLSAHTALVAATPSDVIGAPRATVLALARQERAIAGINGDFFYLADATAVPRGGLSRHGRVLKSALVSQRAALYVTSSGTAAIGDPGFAGLVRTDAGRSYKIRSRNSLENARNGGLTLADANLLTAPLPRCTVARLAATSVPARWRVTSVRAGVTSFVRPAAGTRALATCGPAGEQWMADALKVGHDVDISAGYAVAHITTLLSGGRVLIRSGARYDDKNGLLGYGNQRKPETFGCVLRDGRHVLLGVIEGDRTGAAGMTYGELTTYLLGRHCWSALTFDGSGSSTLVAKRPGGSLAVQNRTTNKGGPRKVVDGLFVVRS
jgi:hypothetical protein